MKCPECHSEIPEGMKFCGQCGCALERVCTHCKGVNPSHFKFCGECGKPLATFSTIQQHGMSVSEGERKHISVLFSDLSGYTSLSEKLDPEEVKGIMNRIFNQVTKVVSHHEGTIEKFIGDAVVVFFGIPKAHEDDPVRAIRTALEIHEIVRSISPELEGKIGKPLAMHTGINTGLVVTGKGTLEEGALEVAGDSVNVASRLSGLARPGEILIGENTYHQAKAYFTFEKLESIKLKGKADPITPYRVVEEKTKFSHIRGLATQGISSPLVGRDAEFVAMKGCVNRLLDGQGGILSIIGEAGLGKSRLMDELRFDAGKDSLQWLEGHTLSYGQKISYWPFREIVRHYVGITDDDSDTEAWEKLKANVSQLFPSETEEILPYIASLATLDIKDEYVKKVKYLNGEALGRQIFLASRRFFEKLAQERPLILVFEDLHWADESSTLLLEHLLPLVHRVPILMCGVSRPEANTPAFHLKEIAAKDYERRYTEIRLDPLSQTESVQLMQNLLEIENLPARVREIIVHKAEGNPFFLEEIMRSLIEDGTVVFDTKTGHWKTTSNIETVTIPDTIQGVIMARVDRLDEELKQVLRSASVIGRAFLYRILKGINEAVYKLDQCLVQLEGMELICQQQKIPELEYIFKHALVQESTYESILLQKRSELHTQVAQVIEALFPEKLEEFYAMLAHHYVKGEVWDKAQEYLFKAGDQAGRIAADSEALAYYKDAIETYGRVFGDTWNPVQRASLERKMGEAFFRRGKNEQAAEYLQRALTYLGKPLPREGSKVKVAIVREMIIQVFHRLSPRLFVLRTDMSVSCATEETGRCYETLNWLDVFTSDKHMLLDNLKLLNFSEKKGFRHGVVMAYEGIAIVSTFLALHRLAYRYARMGANLAEKSQDPGSIAYANLIFTVIENFQGRFHKAIEFARIATDASRKEGYWNLHVWGSIGQLLSISLAYLGRFNEALECARDLVKFGKDANDLEVWCWGLYALAFGQVRTGDFDHATANLKEAIDLAERIPDHKFRVYSGNLLGKCYLRQGKLEQALAMVEENQDYAAQHDVKLFFGHYLAIGEAYQLMSERCSGSERGLWLKKARPWCSAGIKHGKAYGMTLPYALLVQGMYWYSIGKSSAAQQLWRKSIAAAKERSMPWELGMTHLEMGKRLNDRAHLEYAEKVFAEIGAEFELAETRKFLQVLSG